MRQILEESGMHIPYQDNACYMIEKSPVVAKLNGVKIVEFVQANGMSKVVMLEAKTSAPQPTNKQDYDEYVREIREKFQNSMSLLNAAKLKRYPKLFDELPQPLKDVNYKEANYWLYFVIKNSKDDWIRNLSDDLHRQLHPFLKTWKVPDSNFIVVNEGMAQRIGIVE